MDKLKAYAMCTKDILRYAAIYAEELKADNVLSEEDFQMFSTMKATLSQKEQDKIKILKDSGFKPTAKSIQDAITFAIKVMNSLEGVSSADTDNH